VGALAASESDRFKHVGRCLVTTTSRRLRLGRVQFYIDPRDAWIGVYVDPKAIYVCPLPFVVVRWAR
jgi:hypothetical protein